MKPVRKHFYCARCGDEIPAVDHALMKETLCALCDNMRLEAQQVLRDRRLLKAIKPDIRLVHPTPLNPRSSHR